MTESVYLDPSWEMDTKEEDPHNNGDKIMLESVVEESAENNTRGVVYENEENILPAMAIGLEEQLNCLVDLVANITESYTSIIFLADNGKLHPIAWHSLSRAFNSNCVVRQGEGLVGWTAENKVRISVSPFEQEPATLAYYQADEESNLKSFYAVPIISYDGKLIGVISCDSKKSYAFPKITEKLLLGFAKQAAYLVHLHKRVENLTDKVGVDLPLLHSICERLSLSKNEEQLFSQASQIPAELIPHEASVIAVQPLPGQEESGKLYGYNEESINNHRLMELVCKHKKVLCKERSVHVLPTTDLTERSFLSIPISFLGSEAGTLNVLSYQGKGFSSSQVKAAESLGTSISRNLERLRLKDYASQIQEKQGYVSWNELLKYGHKLFLDNGRKFALAKLNLTNLEEIEEKLGTSGALEIEEKLKRFAKQLSKSEYLLCKGTSGSLFLLLPFADLKSYELRLKALLKRATSGSEYDFNITKPNAGLLAAKGLCVSAKELSTANELETVLDSSFISKPKSEPAREERRVVNG